MQNLERPAYEDDSQALSSPFGQPELGPSLLEKVPPDHSVDSALQVFSLAKGRREATL
jgi:hypothetical protein